MAGVYDPRNPFGAGSSGAGARVGEDNPPYTPDLAEDDYTLYDHGQSPYGSDPYGRSVTQPMKSVGAPWAVATRRPRRKKRRWLALTLAAIIAILLAGVGSVVIGYLKVVNAPAQVVSQFCSDVQAQRYASMYTTLSGGLRGRFNGAQFVEANTTLDRLAGRASSCGLPSGAKEPAYSAALTAMDEPVALSRRTVGALKGSLHLTKEQGAWKIAAFDPALLGANLEAIVAVDSYCEALLARDYHVVYGFLGDTPRGGLGQDDYTQFAQLRDAADGVTSGCQITGLDTSQDATTPTFPLTLTRSKLGRLKGTVQLAPDGEGWKISVIAPTLQGSDLGALQLANRLCHDLATDNATDFWAQATLKMVVDLTGAAIYNGIAGVKWTGCAPTLNTYKVTGDNASVAASLAVTKQSTGVVTHYPVTFQFLLVGDVWKLDGIAR